jgi:ketosteroid isomerase-like protein
LSSQSNKQAMRRVLKAYGEGDHEPVTAILHDDIVWTSNAPAELFRFGGTHRGKSEAVMGMAMISADYTTHHYEVLELVGEDDVVWMTARLDMTARRNGKNFKLMLASRWQFQHGMLVAITEYYDSAMVALAEERIAATA